MKKLLLLLFISANSYGQVADTSMNARMEIMEKNMYKLTENLRSAHSRYRIGTKGLIVGSGLIAWGAASTAPLDTKQLFVFSGSFINLLAAMIMIDSHKFIGRAGRLEYDFNSIKWNFNAGK